MVEADNPGASRGNRAVSASLKSPVDTPFRYSHGSSSSIVLVRRKYGGNIAEQGSQFTSLEFTQLLKDHGIAISMDGRGCWRDNVFVERLWKSIKYEEVYLRAYETVSAAKSGIGRYLAFYNSRRPHSTLDGDTPDAFYYRNLPALQEAA
jgi:transposase InsO family protein